MKFLFTASLRKRLTFWYTGVLAAILALYIAAVFTFQYALLKRQMYHDEVQDMVTVEGLLHFNAAGALQLQQDYFTRPRSRLLVDRLMEVRDPQGAVLYRSPTLQDRDLGGPPFPEEGSNSFDQRTFHLSTGEGVYLISHTHPVEGRQLLIRLGYSLAPLQGHMFRFLALLVCTVPLALIAAAFAGFQIAKRALQPLDVMATRAASITENNLNDRLSVPPDDDELGHMAQVLNRLLERLESAFTEMKRFTADAAHELRTPLANQRVTGEIALRENTNDAGYRDAISEMLEETSRLNRTLNSLMVLSKMESQQIGGTLTRFRLSEVVDEVCNVLDVLVEERGIVVVQRQMSGDQEEVTASRDFVRLAVMNVMHNAVKFSPHGGTIEIHYAGIQLGSSAGQRMCVKDAGPGIQQDEFQKVFERFYTSSASQAKMHSGAGLGLSIAKLAVERCNGRLFFNAGGGDGATCCMEIPLSPEHSSENRNGTYARVTD